LKAREKLEAKITNVKEAEERMRLKIKQIQEGRNDKN
jgi:ribosomal protein S1